MYLLDGIKLISPMIDSATSPICLPVLPVSWQTATFLLTTLAISAMAQPSGHFLGRNPRDSMYLRSSPFFCAADTILIIIHIGYFIISPEMSFRDGFSTYIRERFINGVEQSETLQTLYDQMWIRWVFLLLGTLLPALKLIFDLGRVSWTKWWGAMFLSSIIITEILVFFGGRWLDQRTDVDVDINQRLLRLEEEPEQAGRPANLPAIHGYSNGVNQSLLEAYEWLCLLALAIHVGFILWAACDLKTEPQGFLVFPFRMTVEIYLVGIVAIVAVHIFQFCFGLIAAVLLIPLVAANAIRLAILPSGRQDFFDVLGFMNENKYLRIVLYLSFGLVLLMASVACYFVTRWVVTIFGDPLFIKWTIIDCTFLLVALVIPLLLYYFLGLGCDISCTFGRKLMLIEECHCMDQLEDGVPRGRCSYNKERCRLATFSFSTFILFFLWYSVSYDSVGTYVSEWTNAVTGN